MRLILAMLTLTGLSGFWMLAVGAALAFAPLDVLPSAPQVVQQVIERRTEAKRQLFRSPLSIFDTRPLRRGEPQQPPKPYPNEPRLTLDEARLIDAVNHYRRVCGLSPLAPSPTLMTVARQRARVMTNACAHHPGGVWPSQACRKAGYRGPVNEDFAQDFTPERAVWAWKQSYGHAMAMKGWMNINNRWVNQHYADIGVGVYRSRNVAIFGRPD